MRVQVLTSRSTKGFHCAYPLRAFQRQLKAQGLDVRVQWGRRSVPSCDVLCVSSEYSKSLGRDRSDEEILARLQRFRDKARTIIWFDRTDSTGSTFFDVMPYVDLYAKNQLLKDRSLYTTSFYGTRYHADYYHRTRGLRDKRESERAPARPEDLGRLAVSWNFGLGNYVGRDVGWLSRFDRLQFYWPSTGYRWVHTPPQWDGRDIDVSYRGRIDYDRETVSYQRRETRRLLGELCDETGCRVAPGGKLPYREYRDEMRRCRFVLSPFGFGEINAGRDFECFVDGAALVKPDMSHMETWPDYFEAGVTYVPYAWDFSDFKTTMKRLLSTPDEASRIAATAQERYLRSLGPGGGEAFALRFRDLVEKAVAGRR